MQVQHAVDQLQYAMQVQGLRFPNVAFMFSGEDNRPRWCGPKREHCKAPLFSLIKTIGHEDGDVDRDIVVPCLMRWTPNTVYYYPWELKRDKGEEAGRQSSSACSVACFAVIRDRRTCPGMHRTDDLQ